MGSGTVRSLRLAGLLAPLLLLGAGAGDLKKEAEDGLDVYFRDTALEELAKQQLASFPDTEAGESKKLGRSFPDAPPQVPHAVENMLPIFSDENECLDCHHPENAISKKDVPIPKTHFKRAVMSAGGTKDSMVWVVKGYEESTDLDGARYNCNMCHVARSGNAKVIGSSFGVIKGKPTQ
ncbi:MAG: nitrate reductase cytochrome c-type subunit [Deltaproteobacteria bacterium]|nr:nitrate reductase cytochrome c-type subunit [Deltaproteobacteria bacterium]